MSAETVDWRSFREFRGTDLESSWVLSWSLQGETLLVDVDLHLLPEHAFYEEPRPSQQGCIRAAQIEFRYCESIGIGAAEEQPANVVGRLEHGRIAGLRLVAEGRYQISGEFGTVMINAERPLLKLMEM